MVGQMLSDIEERMTQPAEANVLAPALAIRVDPIHLLSVAAGYIGLAGGFGATVFVCLRLIEAISN
jgi:hypothetical protein